MPIYEFKCENCGNIDELLMKISEPNPDKCTKCQGPVHKLMSMSSFSLKGSGWYVTDYKSATKDSPSPTASEPASSATAAKKEEKAPAVSPTENQLTSQAN